MPIYNTRYGIVKASAENKSKKHLQYYDLVSKSYKNLAKGLTCEKSFTYLK